MATSTAPARHGWTYEQYLELNDDQRYELLDGELLLTPAPSRTHQRISREISVRMASFVSENGLGELYYAPFDVVFSETEVVQPDLLFVSRERLEIIGEHAVHGAPDLVVEILSPASFRQDRHRKKQLYERAGVREYWIVDPANHAIEVFSLGEQGYELTSSAAEIARVESRVLAGCVMEVWDIMNG